MIKTSFVLLCLTLSFGVVFSAADADSGFKNESEAGLIVTSGNTRTQSYTLKQQNTYAWTLDLVRFDGRFLKSSNSGVESARNWMLGLRYERTLFDRLAAFFGQSLESDSFAGYLQRYNTDVGGKYRLMDVAQNGLDWSAEAGYRYTKQNFVSSAKLVSHYLRFYTEAMKPWTKTFSTKLWIEGLPNLSQSDDYQINGEFSLIASLSDIFSLKTGYLARFDHVPAPGAASMTDTVFTTALLAKF